MKNQTYLILAIMLLLGLSSCQRNEEFIETETTTEKVDMSLRINNRSVLTSDSFAAYCEETTDGSENTTIQFTNTGLRISELEQLDELDLNLGEFLIFYMESDIDIVPEPIELHILVAFLDLNDGNGPTYVVTDIMDQSTSILEFSDASEALVAGTFSGTVYFVDDINDPDFDFDVSNIKESAEFEVTFSSDEIEVCP